MPGTQFTFFTSTKVLARLVQRFVECEDWDAAERGGSRVSGVPPRARC